MANPVSTTCDQGAVQIRDCQWADGVITFGGAATYKVGTILARDSATGKLIAYVKAGVTNGNGIPKGILAEDLVATGAGDLPGRFFVKGEFVKEKLIIQADGSDTNIDAVVIDLLQDFGLTAVSAKQLAVLDN
jgi:hypothetical protein